MAVYRGTTVYKDQLRRGYKVKYQPEYQAGYQPEGPKADTQPEMSVDTLQVGLKFIISVHKSLVENMSKYTRLINVICFDHMTRFLCFDWLKSHAPV